MRDGLSRISDGVARRWCKLTHPDPMWPMCGKYICPRCQRVYVVPWEQKTLDHRVVSTHPAQIPVGVGSIAAMTKAS